ncbi:myotubularin, putative [Entamoeba histolytica HM-1:IMSS-B]|uniref:Myotubularin, putative n=4 Tax=Entamoeba histolytica TaxID=5759 RepID=C4M179_ENTH1|nr:myotubularin, putative [Entamoeba histolytica HM-1:IMSS]EAL48285.1 myotubularin, putative [Entamoeba histolytica HM-1:IMSS]EMH74880.1 myotubularin, putative [Entamoeba histolytica HM-1:IMSS-B]ENY63519.1 myotubularin, putative [Entamoeba histolytica HM-1:IMSS-A]GAT94954.1 myotubularin putative [Entamoeba histolytica]|eukprot:XP_653671.1 myotubularin, putative [Entamoeba histolytica HM-1:IMSS]
MFATSKNNRKGLRATPHMVNALDHQIPFIKLCQTEYRYHEKTKQFIYTLQNYFSSLEVKYYETLRVENGDNECVELNDEYKIPQEGIIDVIGWIDNNRKNSQVFFIKNECKSLIIQYQSFSTNIIYNHVTRVSDLVQFYFQLLVHIGVIKDVITSRNWMQYGLKLIDQKKRVKILRGSSLIWGMLNEKTVLKFERIMKFTDYNIESHSSSEIVDEIEVDYILKSSNENYGVLCCVMIQNTQTFETMIDRNWTCIELKSFIFKLGEINDQSLKLYKRKGLYQLTEMKECDKVSEYIETDNILCIDITQPSKDVFLMSGRISFNEISFKSLIQVNVYLLNETPKYVSCPVVNTFNISLTSTLTIKDIITELCPDQDCCVFIHINGNISYLTIYDTVLVESEITKIGIIKTKNFPFLLSRLKHPKTYKVITSLLPNEQILYIEHNLFITNYQTLIWNNNSFIKIPHCSVCNCVICTINENLDVFSFLLKDFRLIIYEVSPILTPRLLHIYSENKLLFPRDKKEIFVFRTPEVIVSKHFSSSYDILNDFKRMGVIGNPNFMVVVNLSKIQNRNNLYLSFKCETYPSKIILPNGKYDLNSLVNYRAKGRFPVISWVGPMNQCLSRSAQPLPGTFGQIKCESDVSILQSMMELCGKKTFFVYDARPKLNTKATRFQGGGMESQSTYPFCTFENLALDSIKDIKQAFYKMIKTIVFERRDVYDFKTSIENSKWLQSIDQLITYASVIASKLNSGYSLLIHCRNGWDSTCQLTSLVMMMVDSYYRNIEGFLVLIQREWVEMGHRFPLRTGCGVKWDIDVLPFLTTYYGTFKKVNQNGYRSNLETISDKATSPIFFQFLEAVHHLRKNASTMFQFNEEFLIFIADSLYDGRFTTFFENTIKTEDINPRNNLYEYVLEHMTDFINSNYKESSMTFFPIFDMSEFSVWNEYYFRNASNILRVPQTSK